MSTTFTTESVSIVQMGRKKKLMHEIEESNSEFHLVAAPASKMRRRSSPVIETADLKMMYNRAFLTATIRQGFQLKHVEKENIRDYSSPLIDLDAKIQFSERKVFLNALLLEVERFYIRVLSAVNNISHSSADTARYVRANAPSKARLILARGKGSFIATSHQVVDIISSGAGKITSTADKATDQFADIITDGAEKAGDLIAGVAGDIFKGGKSVAGDIFVGGKNVAGGVLEGSKTVAGGVLEGGKTVAGGVLEGGKTVAGGVLEGGKQVKSVAGDLLENGMYKAHTLLESGKDKASSVADGLFRITESTEEALMSQAKSIYGSARTKTSALAGAVSGVYDRVMSATPSSPVMLYRRDASSMSVEGAVCAVHDKVMCDIVKEHQHTLRHVLLSEMSDRSKPVLPSAETLTRTQSPTERYLDRRTEALSQIKSADLSSTLRHVSADQIKDTSAPVMPSGSLSVAGGRQALFEQVRVGTQLKHSGDAMMAKELSAPVMVNSSGVSSM